MNKEITLEDLKAFERAYDSNPANRIAEHAAGHNGVYAAAYDTALESKITPTFSLEVKETGSVANQKSSGRCWMFAGLNVIRSIAMKKLHVKNLELSESYLMFFDKLEKSNLELEAALDHIDEDDDSRLLATIYRLGGGEDGGYWHFFTELVRKYGVCPKSAQLETVPTSASSEMDDVLSQVLSRDVSQLRAAYREGKTVEELRALKEGMLSEVYRILTICIGKPVTEFTYEYREDAPKKGEDQSEEKPEEKKEQEETFRRIHTTPKEFFDTYVGADLDDYVDLVNWPIRGFKLHQTYTSELCDNVVGGKLHKSLTVDLKELKDAIVASLKGGDLVWFACDVTPYLYRNKGILDTKLIDLDTLFDTTLGFDKGERLLCRASQCNHAMTFTGANIKEDGSVDKWKVENSWGEKVGYDGYWTMTDRFFDNYVYEAVVNKKYIPEDLLKALEKDPVVLPPWSPVNVG